MVAGDDTLQTKLEALLAAFLAELPEDRMKRLARILAELTGPGARTISDTIREARATVDSTLKCIETAAET